jgi:hypothetical protein
MAGRLLNRRELRRESDAAEAIAAPVADEAIVVEVPATEVVVKPARKSRAKAKGPAVPRVKKPRAPKAPPRQRARWGVFDAGMKQVAIFDYNQRAAADEKLANLLGKGKGGYFVQMVKELLTEPDPVEPAVVV